MRRLRLWLSRKIAPKGHVVIRNDTTLRNDFFSSLAEVLGPGAKSLTERYAYFETPPTITVEKLWERDTD